ncbi:MAG TPA: polysaccharide deacetylase family protein [Jatrophihabitans sp.]|jgi:peptidoglycan/xylan/chitin deacetylase (PgdA/CDA1 family)|uniref:polysaccharide deacetylase family protein n=1 Tax=Jatrophihabitans sp. TaxID=1932789 RepID=UPI002F1A00C9
MDNAMILSGTPAIAPGCVALTYDDGPGPRSAELAQSLREEGVSATFFVLGESIKRYGPVLQAYADYGHTIGLHSEYHRPFSSVALAADQLGKCRKRVEHHLGPDYFSDTIWHRPPYGVGDEPVPGYAGPVGWHASGRDWDITYRRDDVLRPPSNPRPHQTVAGCVDEIFVGLQRFGGGVVLLHDFAPFTEFTAGGLAEADLDLQVIDITMLLLRRLRDAGFTFVSLSDPAPAGRGG